MCFRDSAAGPSLDELQLLPDPARRGLALEQYVARTFRVRHFTVILNARAASPRQTDLLAVKLDDRYLIECKWQNKPATIEDVDALRARLSRTRPDIVGVLISMEGFTNTATDDVQARRHQPILLLSGSELRELENGFHGSLPALLYRKREALLRDASVLLDGRPARPEPGPGIPYPQPELHFSSVEGGIRTNVIDCRGQFEPVTFSHKLVDIDWTPATGTGVSLDLQLDFDDEAEVLHGLDILLDHGWVSEDGRWSIHQAERTWHGIGLEALVGQIPQWRDRAHHHSEQIAYIDRCDGGFYSIVMDISASEDRRVSYMELSFQLVGMPLDSSPLLHLCRALGVYEGIHIRPLKKRSRRLWHPGPARIEVAARWHVVADDWVSDAAKDPWVTGIVVGNPFLEGGEPGLVELPHKLAALRTSEFLICDLRHHHPQSYRPSSYFLHHFEWSWAGERMVCRPVADYPYPPQSLESPRLTKQ